MYFLRNADRSLCMFIYNMCTSSCFPASKLNILMRNQPIQTHLVSCCMSLAVEEYALIYSPPYPPCFHSTKLSPTTLSRNMSGPSYLSQIGRLASEYAVEYRCMHGSRYLKAWFVSCLADS